MSVLTKLKKAESQVAVNKRRDKANKRYAEGQMKKIFRACHAMMREEIPPLNGRKVNDCKITVKKIKGGYRIFTGGFGYDQERTLEVTTQTFTGTFRPADDCPEQDYTDHGICIKWWRRGERQSCDPMNDSICPNTGALEWDKEIRKKRKEFQESLTHHIERCVGL